MSIGKVGQEDDVVIQSLLWLEGRLKVVEIWFNQGPKDESLVGLYQVGSQCNLSVVVVGNVADTVVSAATLETHFIYFVEQHLSNFRRAYQKRNRYHIKTDGTRSE